MPLCVVIQVCDFVARVAMMMERALDVIFAAVSASKYGEHTSVTLIAVENHHFK